LINFSTNKLPIISAAYLQIGSGQEGQLIQLVHSVIEDFVDHSIIKKQSLKEEGLKQAEVIA